MPAAGFGGEPAAAEAELAAAAAGSEMLLAAVAAVEPVADGWLCGGAGTGGAGIAAGDEWLSAAGSPPASVDGSAAAAGSASVAGSAYMSLYKNRVRKNRAQKLATVQRGTTTTTKVRQPLQWFETLNSKMTDSFLAEDMRG